MSRHPGSAAIDTPPQAIHATAVAVRDMGVLIRGRSGYGKSSLALALIDLGRVRGFHACLVGDDRVYVRASAGELVVEPHPAILGKIERRGVGILTIPYQAHAVVRLVVDFVPGHAECDIPPRIADAGEFESILCGIPLPRMTLLPGTPPAEAALTVLNQADGTWTQSG